MLIILKIIGILLLAVLGFLLGILFLLLFVPVRYWIKGSYYGKPEGYVKVTWLLHIVSLRAGYQDNRASFCFRLFGFPLFRKKEEDDLEKAVKDGGEDIAEAIKDGGEALKSEELLQIQEVETKAPQSEEKLKDPREEERAARQEPETASPKPKSDAASRHKENGMLNRGKGLVKRIKARILTMAEKIKTLELTWEKVRNFLNNTENKKTFSLVCRQAKRLARHILPGRMRGQITFGFDDPYYTGQILSLASILYPFCFRSLKLYPVFDQVMLEGEIDFRGRIRLVTVAALSVRVYLDKNFRTLLKRWR